MLQDQKPSGHGRSLKFYPGASPGCRGIGLAAAAELLQGLPNPVLRKPLDHCPFELPLDSIESKGFDSSEVQGKQGNSGDTDCDSNEGLRREKRRVRWSGKRTLSSFFLSCDEFEMGNNSMDKNNCGQGVDMQNLPSMAEQIERQRTWMTISFRYRMNWYEAKSALAKLTREAAYKTANLPLWTRCLNVHLHRKTIFLNAIRAFRNRMQCGTSGVRFTMDAFYRDPEAKKAFGDAKDPFEARPLPLFKCPDDMPEVKTMVVAHMNVYVSNSEGFFDQFWDESLKQASRTSRGGSFV